MTSIYSRVLAFSGRPLSGFPPSASGLADSFPPMPLSSETNHIIAKIGRIVKPMLTAGIQPIARTVPSSRISNAMQDGLSSSLELAARWCKSKGEGWSVVTPLGKGGTAPVFELNSPDGCRALKIYDAEFSSGEKGEIERKRIDQQLALRGHTCPYLVQVYEGGEFEGRLYLLMSRAPGNELEKRLVDIPRDKIRNIVDQVTRAALFLRSKNLCHRDIKAANIFISNDFVHTTLLDISVVRNIYDPIGVGSDQGGRLPVLATARYSPPEYLFRLLETGPELWHALTIYQLGALVHDLAMREPLFQEEYAKSISNRYRFAWIVATTIPFVEAADVDHDLLFLAQRALDKDWERRSRLKLEDFLADPTVEQSHALQVIGISGDLGAARSSDDVVIRLKRVRQVAKLVEEAMNGYLRGQGVRSLHSMEPGQDDHAKSITFSWKTDGSISQGGPSSIKLQLQLKHQSGVAGYHFQMAADLSEDRGGQIRQASMEVPPVKDIPDCESQIVAHAINALSKLAVDLARVGTV